MKKALTGLMLILMVLSLSGYGFKDDEMTGTGVQDKIHLKVTTPYLYICKGEVPFTITNESGKRIHVLMIPLLERLEASEWETISFDGVGFCGVPDGVDEEYTGSVPLSWYGDAVGPGEYRLSYSIVDGRDYRQITSIYDEFIIE